MNRKQAEAIREEAEGMDLDKLKQAHALAVEKGYTEKAEILGSYLEKIDDAIDEQQATSFPNVQVTAKGEPCGWPRRRPPERILLSMLDSMGQDQKKKRRRRRGPRVLVGSYGQRSQAVSLKSYS